MSKSKTFLFFCLSFICGIAMRSFVNINIPIYESLMIAAVALVFLWQNNKSRYVTLGIIFLILGAWHMDQKMDNLLQLHSDDTFSTIKQFYATVIEEPSLTDTDQEIIVSSALDGTQIFIRARFYPDYKYGDILNIICDTRAVDLNSFGMYLLSKNITRQCRYPKITIVGNDSNTSIKANLINIRQKFSRVLINVLPAPESSLLNGLLVGTKDNFSKELKELFRKTGTSHIVALSGWNITIIISIVAYIFLICLIHPRYNFWLTIVFIVLFIVMVGGSASIMRAAFMAIAVLIAKQSGRLANTVNVLIFALTIMLVLNPMILRWDLGFQLSFLAMLGLIYIDPILTYFWISISFIRYGNILRYLNLKFRIVNMRLNNQNAKFSANGGSTSGGKAQKAPRNKHAAYPGIVAKILISTLSAQIVTLPLIVYSFHNLPLLAPIANVLIIPLIPGVTIMGFIIGLVGLLYLPLAKLLGFLVWPFLKYIFLIMELFASLNMAVVTIDHMSLILLIWYYILLIYFIIKMQPRRNCQRSCED